MKKKVKEKFERKKPHCNIGTIGHVDHGKTTLTAAITKVLSRRTKTISIAYDEIDKDVQERARGITINASHIEYETEKRHYTHIDCPGHQDYIKNMIIGATQMEGVILVVALTDGPQEQTREHIILAKEIGIEYLIVYGNKVDALLEPEMQFVVEMETREMLELYGYKDVHLPMVCGSAQQALYEREESEIGSLSILNLMNNVDNYIVQPKRLVNEPFLMAVEDVLSITGRGTVLTGKIERGRIKVNDDVELIGVKKYSTTCIGLEIFHKILEMAEAGENVGVLVRGISRHDIKRGFVIAHPKTVEARDKFEGRAYILTREEGGRHKPFFNKFKPQFFFRTSNITGSIELSEEQSIVMPGDTIEFKVFLVEKVVLNVQLRFAIREGTLTIGAGYITKIL